MPKQKQKKIGKGRGSKAKTTDFKRGRDKDGKKVRWTEERKLQENVLFLSPKASSALKELQDKRDQLASLQEPELTEHQKLVESNRQKKKKRRIAQKKRERAKTERLEEGTGDTLIGLNFDDSFDEEEEEIKEEKEKKKIEKLQEDARGMRKVFVKGLPFKATIEDVQKHFESCGTVVDINYPMHEDGKRKGFAFVEFDTDEAVVQALMKDGLRFGNMELVISVANEGKGKGKGKDKKKKRRRATEDDSGSDDGEPDFEYELDSSGSDDDFGGGRGGKKKGKKGGAAGKSKKGGAGTGKKKGGKKKR